MAIFLSKRELARTEPAENLDFKFPVPTRIVSNGEFIPCLKRSASDASRNGSKIFPRLAPVSSGWTAASSSAPAAAWRLPLSL